MIPEADEDDATLFADALPDEPRAADLGERCDDEQGDGLEDGHGLIVAPSGESRLTLNPGSRFTVAT